MLDQEMRAGLWIVKVYKNSLGVPTMGQMHGTTGRLPAPVQLALQWETWAMDSEMGR